MHSKFPKHIILSRKGWDSKAGGKPSPILDDGTHVSLPIPDCRSGITYNDVRMRNGQSLGPIVESLSRGRVSGKAEVHLDPDIAAYTVDRPRGFKAAFGQCGAAQTHLSNEGVGGGRAEENGALFLFFGLYHPVKDSGKSWAYARGRDIHMLFGWLQVGTVLNVPFDKAPAEVNRHPHVVRSFIVRNELGARRQDNNTLYLARERLSFAPDIAGAGVFGAIDFADMDDPRRLTYADNTCSQWRLPGFFEKLSNMGKQAPPRDGWWYPQRRGPGQEFVLNTSCCEQEAQKWLVQVLKHAPKAKGMGASR